MFQTYKHETKLLSKSSNLLCFDTYMSMECFSKSSIKAIAPRNTLCLKCGEDLHRRIDALVMVLRSYGLIKSGIANGMSIARVWACEYGK